MLRRALLGASRSKTIKNATTRAPIARDVVRRFVAGETVEDAIGVTRQLVGAGLLVSLDHLGEDTRDTAQGTPSCVPTSAFWNGFPKPA